MNLLVKLFLISTLIFNLSANENIDNNDSFTKSWEYLKKTAKDFDTPANRDKALIVYESSKKKFKELASNVSCSFGKFNVKKAQLVTYEVRVKTKKGISGSGTAIALSSTGKLITAYHNIDSYESIIVIDSESNEYNATIGHISTENDLAYLYIDTKAKPFVTFANEVELGEDIFILSYDDLLLKGIVSKNNPNSIILNVEAQKGTSGGGVFNSKNELVAILLQKDYLDKTSYAVKPNMFKNITQNFIYKKELLNLDSNNYDNSYCYDKNDLKVWAKYAKSKDPKIQEFHAIFLGLCKKVEDRDLTTEEAQFIFEQSRTRLFGK
jgi:S1-C subfamily serine protease